MKRLTERIARFHIVNLETRNICRQPLKLIGRAYQHRKCSEVHGNYVTDAEQVDSHGCLPRIHRVVVADRQERYVGRVELANNFHVAKDGRITGMINRKSTRKTNYVAACFSAVNDFFAVLNSARMDRVDHCDLNLAHTLSATFV